MRIRLAILALVSSAPLVLPAWRTPPRHAPRAAESLIGELGCAGCHAGMPARTSAAPPLGPAGARYDAAWLFAYLTPGATAAAPRAGTRARMPDFGLDDAERVALAAFLSSSGEGAPPARASAAQASAYRAARSANAGAADAALGRRIFVGMNCAGCHAYAGIGAWAAGPDLSAEGSRVRPEWLRGFLARPHAVRPYGAYPGTGSRMPDFRLTPAEVDTIGAYLAARRVALPAFAPRPLTPFARAKAAALIRDQLPCLGCHRLGEDGGGRIAPDLSAAGARLRPEWVAAMLRDPRHTVPSGIMPRVPMAAATEELIASFVAARDPAAAAAPGAYLSPARHAVIAATYADSAPALYARYCSHCHGESGRGDGWNARYLPARPTAHADARAMSARPDGTLHDGIHAGGRILGRSNRMPPFGETLTRDQVAALVRHIRALCGCEGPAWSRTDGAARR